MARILYSLAQEGRGHASRGYEIIKRLAKKGHNLTVLTGGDSYEPLEEALQKIKGVKLRRIPGLRFKYDSHGRVSYIGTISGNARTFLDSNKIISGLEDFILKGNFELIISDFEPFLPRAAINLGKKLITIDNQHRFVFENPDKKIIYGSDYIKYLLTRSAIKQFHPLGDACIITSSFEPKLNIQAKKSKSSVFSVGPIIRNEVDVLKSKSKKGDFVLVYVKLPFESLLIPIIKRSKGKFIMYVKDPRIYASDSFKNLIYKKHSVSNFAKDLSSCKAVISSAGEQLMSESLYLRKPLFLIPEEGTFEQKLNAELVKKSKVGDACPISNLNPDKINLFLSRLKIYDSKIEKLKITNGVDEAVRIILKIIETKN